MDFSDTFQHQVAQLYSKLLPQPCFLCGAPAVTFPLCSACISDLPLLGHACKRCALPIAHGEICGHCLKDPPIQTASFSLFRYEATVRHCITAYKYQQKLMLSRLFSEMMASHLKQQAPLAEFIIPIPLHPNKIKQRGFNQSAVIAKQLSRQLQIAYLPNALVRIRDTRAQYELNLKQRKNNLKNAFRWQSKLMPDHVVLVDDVMTTGTTVKEAAKTLNKIGISNIEVWTIARAISHY